MNCLSLNIRGMGEEAKVGWVRKLVKMHKINFVGIQETWMCDFNKINVQGCWELDEFEYEGVDSNGRSGGLLCVWNPCLFQQTEVIKSKNYLIVIGRWKGQDGNTIFANIYAPQAACDKVKLWTDLLNIIRSKVGRWVIFGDFNAVRNPTERLNSVYCRRTAIDFNNFIQEAGLHELSMGGLKFTYFHDGVKLSKLDRFLVCHNFLNSFPSAAVTALPRELSDHSPVTLITQHIDFGPQPFKFFNSWLMIEGIDNVVHTTWNEFRGYGPPDAYLAAKLKYLKNAIRKWRNSVYLNEQESLNVMKKTVEELDKLAEVRLLSEEERIKRNISFQKIADAERLKAIDLKQKSRIKWMIDGEENTKFFHGYINNKNRRTRLNGLTVSGQWCIDAGKIKHEVFQFYKNKFHEHRMSRPKLMNPLFNSLSIEKANNIEALITREEVKEAVWACGGDRAPGPDGFTFKFIKTY